MKLRVTIKCVDCGETTEVHVLGGWDLSKVQHECVVGNAVKRAVHTPFEKGPIHVRFQPPRRVY